MSQAADHKKHTECNLCRITPQQLWAYIIVGAVAWGGVTTTLLWLRSDVNEVKETVSRIEARVYTMPSAPKVAGR